MITQKGTQDVDEDYRSGYRFFISEARNGSSTSIRADNPQVSELGRLLADAAWQARQSGELSALEQRCAFGRYLWRVRLTQKRSIPAVAAKAGLAEETCFRIERGLLDAEELVALFPKIAAGWGRSVKMLERTLELDVDALESAEPQLNLRCRSREVTGEEVIAYDDLSQPDD